MADESPVAGICESWVRLLSESARRKHLLFGRYAKEAMLFFDPDARQAWSQVVSAAQEGYLSSESFGASGLPFFKMQIPKVFDAVSLFGPSLYHQNPQVLVSPREIPQLDPWSLGLSQDEQGQMEWEQMQQYDQIRAAGYQTCSKLQMHYLNWVQYQTDKKTQIRRSVNEAIIKGMGCQIVELYQPPGSSARYPRSRFMSCDDILKDPDARYPEDIQWVARRCVHPVNLVERKFGYRPGQLKGTMVSLASQSTEEGSIDSKSARVDAKSYDLIEYWEIYSKNGFGQRLKNQSKSKKKSDYDTERFGDYCYLAISKGVKHPLNLPNEVLADYNASLEAVRWPVPYWIDERASGGWPWSELAFYESPDHIWPIPLVKPAIGPIRFLNWCLSFLADKTAANCKTYVGVVKAAAENIREQMLNNRGPYTMIELSNDLGKNINEIVSFLQTPDFSADIWHMCSEMFDIVDKTTGLTELAYAMSNTQSRSAEDARTKDRQLTIRPDEMASKTEDFLSSVVMKEIECAAWTLDVEDLAPSVGNPGADILDRMVLQDFESLVRNYNYRIEANSARKPNKQTKVSQLTELGQYILPLVQQWALGGEIGPWNAYITELADAMDIDASQFILQQAPQVPGEDPQAEMELEQQKLDQQAQAQEHELQLKTQMQQMQLAAKQQEMQLDGVKAEQEMALKAQEAQQALELKGADAAQNMAIRQQEMMQDSIGAANRLRWDSRLSQAKVQQAKKSKPKASNGKA